MLSVKVRIMKNLFSKKGKYKENGREV